MPCEQLSKAHAALCGPRHSALTHSALREQGLPAYARTSTSPELAPCMRCVEARICLQALSISSSPVRNLGAAIPKTPEQNCHCFVLSKNA